MTRTYESAEDQSAASIIVNMFAGQPTRKEATVFFPERFSSEMQYEQKQHEQNHDYNQVHFSRKSAAYGVGICFESSPNQSLRVAQLEVGCSAYRSGVIERGDEILKVDGEIVEKRHIGMLKDRILGQQGQSVTLTFRRDSVFPNLVYEVELMRGGADYMDLVADNKALVLERDSCKDVVRQLQGNVKAYESRMESLQQHKGKVEKMGLKSIEQSQEEVHARLRAEQKLAESLTEIANLNNAHQLAQRNQTRAEVRLSDCMAHISELKTINQELHDRMMTEILKCDLLTNTTHSKLHALSAQIKILQKTSAYRDGEARKWCEIAKQLESELARSKQGESNKEQQAASVRKLMHQMQTATEHIAELEREIGDKENLHMKKSKSMEDSLAMSQSAVRALEMELTVMRRKLDAAESLKRVPAPEPPIPPADKGRDREIQQLEAELSSQIAARRGVEQRVSALERALSVRTAVAEVQQPVAPALEGGVSEQEVTTNPWVELRATKDKAGARPMVNMAPLPPETLPPPSALDFATRPSLSLPKLRISPPSCAPAAPPAESQTHARPCPDSNTTGASVSVSVSVGAGPSQVSPATSTCSVDAYHLDLEPVVHAQDLIPRVSALKSKFELNHPASPGPQPGKPSPGPGLRSVSMTGARGQPLAGRGAAMPAPGPEVQVEVRPEPEAVVLPASDLQLSASTSPDLAASGDSASEGARMPMGLERYDAYVSEAVAARLSEGGVLPATQPTSALANQERKRRPRSIQFDDSNNDVRLLTPMTPEDKATGMAGELGSMPHAYLFPISAGVSAEGEEVPYDPAEEELIRANTQTNAGSMFSFC